MPSTWRKLALAVGVVGLVATGCATGATEAPVAAPPPVAWAECGPNLDCATVEVPLDYAESEGRQVPLALVRHRATDAAQRIGSLFYNPGGPGGPATDVVRALDAGTGVGPFSPTLMAGFDIVGMDPRGVGDSGGVRCLSDERRLEQLTTDGDPDVLGARPLPEIQADSAELAAGCAAQQDTDYLASLSTDTVARDMDQVRAALGEERLSYLGASYGTLLGATYATLFPQHVRQMVLDAPVDADLWREDPLAATTDQAVAGEHILDLWFATCRAEGTETCPFGAGNPEAAFDALVDRLEAQPLPVAATQTGAPAGVLDGYGVLIGARTAAFDRTLWPVLTAGLLAAEQGDGTLLRTLGTILMVDPTDGTPSDLAEANLAVNCLDRAVPTDLAAHTTQAQDSADRAPRFGALSGYLWLPCLEWPARNDDRYTAPLTGAGAPPILVVGGREDSQTPYAWAQRMTDGLESGVLLTREGVGHGSYRTSGPCIDDAVDATLVDGVLPAEGTVCPQVPAATTRPMTPG